MLEREKRLLSSTKMMFTSILSFRQVNNGTTRKETHGVLPILCPCRRTQKFLCLCILRSWLINFFFHLLQLSWVFCIFAVITTEHEKLSPLTKETWWLSAMWYAELDPGKEKGNEWENWRNLNKVWNSVDSNVPMLIS